MKYGKNSTKSVMKDFANIPSQKLPRAKFDRSHGCKTTFDAGYLVPVFLDELVPGDRVSLTANAVARLATPIYPLMDNLYMDIQFFAVPCRLVWDNWQRFMGERPNPDDTIDQFMIPTLERGDTYDDFKTGSVFDHFGLPRKTRQSISISALPFRAYNLIFNEWYRDQNLQDRVTVNTGDGPDPLADYTLLRRNKRHDYFTSCLPWPQRTAEVELPVGDFAPVVAAHSNPAFWMKDGAGNPFEVEKSSGDFPIRGDSPSAGAFPNLEADLTSATGVTINQLREYVVLQQFAELDARGGTRYVEIIRSHFNVVSSDARLQRPEFLGSVTHRVGVQPVATTGGNDSDARPVGDLGATGYTNFVNEHAFTYSAEEHCYVIGLASVRADLTYSQGINKLFLRQVREDFYWPTFASLGEQPVSMAELHALHSDPASTFGYQERYAEYRFKPSELHGLMRPDAVGTLAAWHLSQDLDPTVALNSDFIKEKPPVDRVVAVVDEPDMIADFYFEYHCERPIPLFGIPGLNRL